MSYGGEHFVLDSHSSSNEIDEESVVVDPKKSRFSICSGYFIKSFIFIQITIILLLLIVYLILLTIYKIYYSPAFNSKEYLFHSLNIETGEQVFGSLYVKNSAKVHISELISFDNSRKVEIVVADASMIGNKREGSTFVCSGLYLLCHEEFDKDDPNHEFCKEIVKQQPQSPDDDVFGNFYVEDDEERRNVGEEMSLQNTIGFSNRRATEYIPVITALARIVRFIPWKLALTRGGGIVATITALTVGGAIELYERLVDDVYNLNRIDREEAIQCIELFGDEKVEDEEELKVKYPDGFCLCEGFCAPTGRIASKLEDEKQTCESIPISFREEGFQGFKLEDCKMDGIRQMRVDCIYKGCKGVLADPPPGCIFSPDHRYITNRIG